MGPAWAYAFLAAAAVTLAGTPLLRRLALATGFVDHPVAAHKSHKSPTPYLGGIGLIAAVLVGMLFTGGLTPQVGVITLGGSLIGCLGLIDDHRSVGALPRFLVEVVIAAVALGAGLGIHATDVPAIDGGLTLIWIVGVTNAVNLLDNMDGLAAGISAAAATAIFALAVLGEQLVTATLAAGLAGACAGFLAHNKRPASIFMGDTGSLFLGFVLALAAIDVSPAVTPPASFVVPLMLLALPVLDTATVTLARLRRGRSISEGGKDHLSHRLVALGRSPSGAVGILIATEAAVGLLAVLAGRNVVPLPVAATATVAVLAALASVTLRAPVYTEPVIGMPRKLRFAAAAGVFAVLVLAAPAALSLARAHGPGIKGADQARAALEALDAGDTGRARLLFDGAASHLREAGDHLGGRMSSLGLLLPGLRANLATTRALVAAGHDVTRAASDLSALVEARSVPVSARSAPGRESARLSPALAESASVLQRSVTALAGYDRPYLWPSLGATVRDFRSSLITAASRATVAADVAALAPALLGEHGPRHYFLAVQDNAELRGGGGVIRLWGEIEAVGGTIRLARFGPIEDLVTTGHTPILNGLPESLARHGRFDPARPWDMVNLSPDFAVTGELITRLYPGSGGREVDGVIAVDLPGLATLLQLAGAVQVDGWPVPITGDNLAEVVLREGEKRFPSAEDRRTFETLVTYRALERFMAADLGPAAQVAAALSDAVRGGHLFLHASRAEEQLLFERLDAAGQVPGIAGDSLLVVNQNVSSHRKDADLHRRVRYDAHLDPGRSPATLNGHVEVTLRNEAAVENRSVVSVYSPFGILGGLPQDLTSATELGRRAYSTAVTVPPRQSRTVALDLQGRVDLDVENWYHLDLGHQTSLMPDDAQITVSVPSGWRIVEARGGIRAVGDRRAVADLPLSEGRRMSVRVERTPWSRLWARTLG